MFIPDQMWWGVIGWSETIWSVRCLGYPHFLSFAEASDLGDRAAGPSLRPRSGHETPDLILIFGVIVKDPLTIWACLQARPGGARDRFHNQRQHSRAQAASLNPCWSIREDRHALCIGREHYFNRLPGQPPTQDQHIARPQDAPQISAQLPHRFGHDVDL